MLKLPPPDPDARAQIHRWLLFAVTELEQPLWRTARHTNLYPEEDRLPQDIELAKRDFAPMAEVAEGHLAGREYLVGNGFTIADIVMAYTLDWANEAGLLGRCPELLTYLERMYERPKAAPRIAEAFAAIAPGN